MAQLALCSDGVCLRTIVSKRTVLTKPGEEMAKGVFMLSEQSDYDDEAASHYQFPNKLINEARAIEGDWIIYYEPGAVAEGHRVYKAFAKIDRVEPDTSRRAHHIALIQKDSYFEFENRVPFKIDGRHFETNLYDEEGNFRHGAQRDSIRVVSDEDFAQIIGQAYSEGNLRRIWKELFSSNRNFGFQEVDEEGPVDRKRTPRQVNSLLRDDIFRSNVLKAYDSRCALTGFSFINGGGAAEVEAAHIRPVKDNGPDKVTNGLALSRTVHWMFDRGLLSLDENMNILLSRHINNPQEMERILVPDRKALIPAQRRDQPSQTYLRWHRENCFKQ